MGCIEKTSGLVSVIVPVYNVEPFLGKCLESILNQSYTKLDVIAVNDGSTDRSADILKEYASKDARLRIITQPNGGLSAARNTALQALPPETEYVTFVDSDDYLPTDAISSLLNCLLEKQADTAIGLYDTVDEKGNSLEICPETHIGNDDVLNKSQMFELLVFNPISNYTHAWGKLHRRHVVDGFTFPPGKIFEDSSCHRLYGKCTRIAFLNKVVYHYLWRTGSILHSGVTIRHLDKVELFIDRIRYLREEGFQEYSTACLAKTYQLLRITLLAIPHIDSPTMTRVNKLLNLLAEEYRLSSFDSCAFKDRIRHWANAHIFWLTYYRLKIFQKSN